jgi:hypothetical protein
LPALVPDRPALSLTGLLPLGFIPEFEDMLREGHFPRLFAIINTETTNAINPNSHVPPARQFSICPLTLDENHGHNGAVQTEVK